MKRATSAYACALVTLAACTAEPETCVVTLRVRTAPESPLAERGDVAHVRLEQDGVAHVDALVDLVGAAQAGGSVTLLDEAQSAVPAGEGFSLVVSILSSIESNVVVAQGRAAFDCVAPDAIDVPLYLGAANAFSRLDDAPGARSGATATALLDGRVLVFGGAAAGAPSAALFDPATGAWCADAACFPAGAPPSRTGHSATLLEDGAVLVIGGVLDGGAPAADVLRFDPSGEFASVATFARRAHDAALAGSDRVLVAGGLDDDDLPMADLTFVTRDGRIEPLAAALVQARAYPAVAALGGGLVLVAGGEDELEALASVEIVDVEGESVDAARLPCAKPGTGSAMLCARRTRARALVMDDGNVLIGGGVAESLDADPAPEADVFYVPDLRVLPAAALARTAPRDGAALARVPCAEPPCPVLIAGGADSPHALFSIATAPVLLGDVAYGGSFVVATTGTAPAARAGIAAAPAGGLGVLVVGGEAVAGPVADAALFSLCVEVADDIPCPAP